MFCTWEAKEWSIIVNMYVKLGYSSAPSILLIPSLLDLSLILFMFAFSLFVLLPQMRKEMYRLFSDTLCSPDKGGHGLCNYPPKSLWALYRSHSVLQLYKTHGFVC